MDKERRDHKVYRYINKINGKVYIGRTCRSLVQRAGLHGQYYKGCAYFWKAIQKYGWENFEGEILEEGLSDEEAACKEEFFIKKFDSTNKNKGYNIADARWSTASDEHRKNARNAQLGKKQSEETREKRRKLMTGRVVSEETRRKIGEKKKGQKMPEHVKKRLLEANIGRPSHLRGRHLSKKARRNLSNSAKKREGNLSSSVKIICVETGVEYYSLMNAQECTGIKFSNISRALRGSLNGLNSTAGGYHWAYVVPPKEKKRKHKRRVLCVETGVEYESAAEASRQTGVYRKSIEKCANGKTKYVAGGYHWEYID